MQERIIVNWPWRGGKVYFMGVMGVAQFLRELGNLDTFSSLLRDL